MKKKQNDLDTMQMVFGLMMALSGFFFLTSPATRTSALLFRIVLFAIGAIGTVVVLVLKNRR